MISSRLEIAEQTVDQSASRSGVLCLQASIGSVLTTGCLLGAVALAGISGRGSYTEGPWSPWIIAHANSQLYGWLGLGVMAFLYRWFVPAPNRSAAFVRATRISLCAILAGIAARFCAEPLASAGVSAGVPLGIGSAVLQAIGVWLFVFNLAVNRAPKEDEGIWANDLIAIGSAWWLLTATVEPLVFALSHQQDQASVIQFIALWFVPYREAQFAGFGVSMLVGIALAWRHQNAPLSRLTRVSSALGLVLWNAGVLAHGAGWQIFFRNGMMPGTDGLYRKAAILLICGATALCVAAWPRGKTERPGAAWTGAGLIWLIIAAGLTLAEPLHLDAIARPFSHAYTGAIRHALTVGFLSQTICGLSLVWILRSSSKMERLMLLVALALLNLGNGGRVVGEVLTDYRADAFKFMGPTGFVELLGIGLWAGCIVRGLRRLHNQNASGSEI